MHRVLSWIGFAGRFIVLLLFAMPGVSAAQEAPATPDAGEDRTSRAFEFYPADTGFGTFFAPVIDAGTSAQLTVILANTGDVVQDLRTYAVNAFTADGGGFASAEYGVPPNAVTQWLDYPEEVYTVEAGTGIERTFTVTVPGDVRPGQYITAIAGEHAAAAAVGDSTNLYQKLRYTVPVFITVPGDARSGFEAGNLTATARAGMLMVTVDVQNTGDLRVRPEGTIDIIDQAGALVASIPVSTASIYAHDQATITVSSPVAVDAGTYTIRANLTDPQTGAQASTEIAGVFIDPDSTPVPTFIAIAAASVSPAPAGEMQFANVEAVISNTGEPIANAQLSLIARVDGVEVERFPISQAVSLVTGDTPISTRYIPATGWTSGEWTFELLLETVEPSGAAVVVDRLAIDGTITIP